MLDKIKALWGRLEVRWHVLAVALLAAAPEVLNWLGVIDLRPILDHFLSPGTAGFIMALLPFALAFLRPIVTAEAAPAPATAPVTTP